jgi:probable DNA metabolism protein
MQIALASPIDVQGFRAQATSLLARKVVPSGVSWVAEEPPACQEPVRGESSRAPAAHSALHSIVPRSFVRLTELVVLHRDPARFDLLYRLLWRLVHEPELAACVHDAEMTRARSMAHAVRRDIARARESVLLRALAVTDAGALWFGWCEPQHHVTEEVAQFLACSAPESAWLLVSPDRSVLRSGALLLTGLGIPAALAQEADDAYWYALADRLRGLPPRLRH